MPLKYQDKELYPLELIRITNNGEVVYDRNTRGKSWFYLILDNLTEKDDE